MMVRMELEVDLATIAGGDNTGRRVQPDDWAEKNGKVLQLIAGAYQYNQDNTLLQPWRSRRQPGRSWPRRPHRRHS